MKKILAVSFLALLSFAPHVFAQGFTALAPIPGLTDMSPTSVINSDTLANFFNNLYKYLIGLAATLAVIQIVWAGLDISFFHKDAVSALVDDKGKIYNAIFGLILVLSPVLVFSIINPSILNLSLNLPAINLNTPTTPATGGNTPPNTTIDPTTKCEVTGGDYFKKVTCATQSALNSFDCSPLLLGVTVCKNVDANGKPLCATFTGACWGKETTLNVYRYYKYGVLVGDTSWVPSDVAAATDFTNNCTRDGGVVATDITKAAVAFLASQVWRIDATNGCSASYGPITVDRNQYGGVVCFSKQLFCNPPN